jgi:Methane oxygenase PmoA
MGEVPALSLVEEHGTSMRISCGDTEIARYVYRPSDVQLESPRPYLHPLRTLGGCLVSLYRPHDHVWHRGIAWSLPHVGPENFWGGPTFVRDKGYEQLANNGAMRHVGFSLVAATPEKVELVESLEWVTEHGQTWFTERRSQRFELIDGAWLLRFGTSFTNVSATEIVIGSPTTEGRPNAGYGGLFWRGPRDFTGGSVHVPGQVGGDELMGVRAPWLAFRGRHDDHGGHSTLVFIAPDEPKWFVRSEPFAAVCPAPFFDREVPVPANETLTFRYTVVVADGAPDPAALAEVAG